MQSLRLGKTRALNGFEKEHFTRGVNAGVRKRLSIATTTSACCSNDGAKIVYRMLTRSLTRIMCLYAFKCGREKKIQKKKMNNSLPAFTGECWASRASTAEWNASVDSTTRKHCRRKKKISKDKNIKTNVRG